MMGARVAWKVVAVALAVGIAACGESPTSAERQGIAGRWKWVRATGGIAGVERTPGTEGYSLHLRFGAHGTVELRRDGVLEVRTSFRLRPPADEAGAPDHPRAFYDEPVLGVEWQHVVRSDADGLVLADPCCDLFVWEFRPAG